MEMEPSSSTYSVSRSTTVLKTFEPELNIKIERKEHDIENREAFNYENKNYPIKSELIEDPLALEYPTENKVKIEPIMGFDSEELLIKSIETVEPNYEICAESAEKISLKLEEEDPLNLRQPCCSICQDEAPSQLSYGGLCCYSCK